MILNAVCIPIVRIHQNIYVVSSVSGPTDVTEEEGLMTYPAAHHQGMPLLKAGKPHDFFQAISKDQISSIAGCHCVCPVSSGPVSFSSETNSNPTNDGPFKLLYQPFKINILSMLYCRGDISIWNIYVNPKMKKSQIKNNNNNNKY